MSSSLSTGMNDWLARHGGTSIARLNQYDSDLFNLLVNQAKVSLMDDSGELELSGSKWVVSMNCTPTADDTYDCQVVFACVSGELSDASVSVDLAFPDWSVHNYVLMPAAVYDGNRFLSRRIPYSPKLWFVDDIGPDKPIIVTDIPKLSESGGPSRIQERSGSMALPSIGFRSAATGRGIWLVTDQGNSLGDYGIGIEENRDRCKATLSITSPVVRELYSYRICDMRYPSVDVPKDFKSGDVVRIAFRLHVFAAPDVQSLFDKYAKIRKPKAMRRVDVLPFSACFFLQEEKFNRENFFPEHGYYSVGLRQNFLQDWQIGWTGGMISTYPLLFAGDEKTRANVIRNFDWLFPNGISPSGFFWDSGARGTEWFGGDIRKPHTGNWHLIRKSADAVFFVIKQFMLMEKIGIEVKRSWRNGTRGVCDSFVRLWQANSQFGQFVDSLTGEIRVGGSTSAALAPAALILAADYFFDAGYLEVAEQSAEYFYQEYTLKGLSCGGPGDALQNPDSESWSALIESYMALYDATHDMKWLERAGETARQFSTWVVSYDFEFPPDSMFGKAGIRTTGSVYANTQNKHSAPGLCTLSGLGLLKLFRATGDRFHLDLLWDIAHGLPQYLPHPLKPLGDAKSGHMCERVNMTDWEGPERIGETLRMTTWAETSLMLTTIEIPGLYVRPDLSLVIAFDHIMAEIVFDDDVKLAVKITNPTPAPATVRILSESNAESLHPLPENALLDCHAEVLGPGESRMITFEKQTRLHATMPPFKMSHKPLSSACTEFHFGASYYPEQIDAGEVEHDARLMREAGFNIARMGEFAWSRIEQHDGFFDFSWLEAAVETLARHGIRSLLCTPTAAPPKWLTDKHPEICQTLADGRRREFGKRRHYCVNSVDYHDHTRRIVTALAERFKDNPDVIGYQLDNEFMAEQPHCYCGSCARKFHARLREKFGTIEELNRRWGMAFWSQTYRSFEEVPLPKADHNPSSLQEFYHFFSDSFVNYAALQADCIRSVSPDKIVTHNVCSSGFLYLLDLHQLASGLDIVSVDNYPLAWTLENEYGNGSDRDYQPSMAGFALSMMRGLRRSPFWVTEAQTGRTFRPRRQLPGPGLIHVWTHQEIAHGAKAVIWFHWRQFPAGIEHLMHAVLECDGKPRRRYFEIQKTIRGIQALAGGLADACPRPEVALLRDYHCDWALDDGHTHPDFTYQRHLYLYYRALFENHVNAEVIHPAKDLADYKLVIAPSLLLMDEARGIHLRRYVEQGGTLILTVQSGLRNFDNALHRETLPAHIHEWCGIEIEEQNALTSTDTTGIAPLAGDWTEARYECQLLFEIIKPTSARPLFHYTDLWFAGTPAITVNHFGKGMVYYIATVPPLELVREMIAGILPECAIVPNVVESSSTMVESVLSTGADGENLHLINYSGEAQTVRLRGRYRMLSGDKSDVSGKILLESFGTAILKRM